MPSSVDGAPALPASAVISLLALVAVGAIAGAVARLVVPTDRRLGCVGTIVLGIVGSLAGGLLGSVIGDGDLELRFSNVVGSILGAVVVLAVVRFIDRS